MIDRDDSGWSDSEIIEWLEERNEATPSAVFGVAARRIRHLRRIDDAAKELWLGANPPDHFGYGLEPDQVKTEALWMVLYDDLVLLHKRCFGTDLNCAPETLAPSSPLVQRKDNEKGRKP